MMALFDDVIEADAHLRALIENQITSVSGKQWLIQPGGAGPSEMLAAEQLQESLQHDELNFHAFLSHQLEAPFKGFSASEILWRESGGRFLPGHFANVEHARFHIGQDGALLLITKDNPQGEPLTPGHWVISRGRHGANLARAGLLRTATWWSHFKRMSVSDWVLFARKFGIPLALGYYNEDTPEKAREAMEEALRAIGSGGAALLHEATRLAFADVQALRDGEGTVFKELIELCDSQNSKLIMGGTLATDSGGNGSYAQAGVHENRSHSRELALASLLERAFLEHVSLPFLRFNNFPIGTRAPRLKIRVVRNLSPSDNAEIASVLVNELGLKIDGWHLAEELGYRKPLVEEDAAIPLKSNGPEPSESPEKEPEDA